MTQFAAIVDDAGAHLPANTSRAIRKLFNQIKTKAAALAGPRNSTGIAWTEATWNPLQGCTRVSAGCDRCYAANFLQSDVLACPSASAGDRRNSRMARVRCQMVAALAQSGESRIAPLPPGVAGIRRRCGHLPLEWVAPHESRREEKVLSLKKSIHPEATA